MTLHGWIRIVFLALSVGVLLMGPGCKSEEGGKGSEEPAHDGEDRAPQPDHGEDARIVLPTAALETIAFKTVTVERRGLEQEIQATAVIEPNEHRLAHVSPRIPGQVIAVTALLGDTVKAGQNLAELDSLEMGRAKAAYLTAKADLEVAGANYKREKRLFKAQISSEKAYLDAKGMFLRADTQLKATREALRLLGLTDKKIARLAWGGGKHPLSHFPLLAPFTGTVVEKHITLGELLKPGDNPYTIADLSTLWIQLNIYEKDLGRVRRGAQARLAIDAYPDESFQGRITYVSDLLDETTRTARARVEIANPERKLKPGMFVTAFIVVPIPHATEVLAIPRAAVHRVRGQPVAFVREGERVFVPRELVLGLDSGPYSEVRAGLSEGERVVTEGGFYLKSTLLKEEMGEGHAH